MVDQYPWNIDGRYKQRPAVLGTACADCRPEIMCNECIERGVFKQWIEITPSGVIWVYESGAFPWLSCWVANLSEATDRV